MKRHLLIICALALTLAPLSAFAAGGSHGHGGIRSGVARGFGFGRGLGFGLAGAGDYSDIYGYAELYRELYNNIPYFALHPPVYYSAPVPRTYGYSPFAYPGDVMTPDLVVPVQPVTIINPHVKSGSDTPAAAAKDKAASAARQVQPLVVTNPYVTARAVAQSE